MVCEFSADMYANPTVLQPVARMPRGGLIGVKNLEKLYLVESEDEETHRRWVSQCAPGDFVILALKALADQVIFTSL